MRNFGALFRDCCQGCQDVLSLPRAIFSQANRRCEAGVQKRIHVNLPGTRTPAANLEKPPKTQCRTAMPNFHPSLVRPPPLFCSWTREVYMGVTGTVGFTAAVPLDYVE